MPNFTLRQLEYFVAAAKAGTLKQAAVECGTSQGAVSLAIRQLEGALHTQLLVRHHAKGVALTDTGRVLLSDSRDLLARAEALANVAADRMGELRGPVKMGCFTPLMPLLAPILLGDIAPLYPDVELTVTADQQEELHHRLARGEIDVAVVSDKGLGAGAVTVGAWSLRPQVIVHEDHPLAHARTVSLRHFADEALVTLDLSTTVQNSESLLHSVGVNPLTVYRVPDIETIRSLVGRGLGYGILLLPIAADTNYEGRRIVSIPIAESVEESRILITVDRGVIPPRRVAAVVKRLRTWAMPNGFAPIDVSPTTASIH